MNPAAFAAPQGLTFGNSPRNIARNPHQINFDMALYKHFAINESTAFEFRAEAFNVFNHTQWGYIAGDSGSAAREWVLYWRDQFDRLLWRHRECRRPKLCERQRRQP